MIDSAAMETKAAAPSGQHTNEIDDVVRHLAHELRQPLSTIETAAYYLEMVLGRADARVCSQVEKIQRMVAQINWMLSDTLHFIQGPALHPHWIDLAEIVRHTIDNCESGQLVKAIWNGTGVGPLVYMNPSHAQHLVHSALAVFWQLADSSQPVSISLALEEQSVLLVCACKAPGNAAGCGDDLFSSLHSRRPAGTGLAVASVRRIAEANGGDLHLSREGEFLKLIVRLPGR